MSLIKKNNRCKYDKINSYSDSKKCPIKSIYKSIIKSTYKGTLSNRLEFLKCFKYKNMASSTKLPSRSFQPEKLAISLILYTLTYKSSIKTQILHHLLKKKIPLLSLFLK